MGLGITSVIAFPNRAISLTKVYEFETLQPDYAGAERLYQEWKAAQIKETCSCVAFVKRLTGFDKSIGYAKNWPRNSEVPVIGGVVITSESSFDTFRTGHVAYILDINDDTLTLLEANYSRCKQTTRKIKVADKKIIGYWKP